MTGSGTARTRKIKTYRPDLIKEGACDIDGDLSYAPKLAAACGTDGLIRVRLDEQAIVQRISHDLYAEPTSALRELYANEVRACRTARDKHGAKPRIDITVDSKHRKLSIEGVDSLGIDQDVFLQVMTVLGKSDNFDGSSAGQFGMGFASYTCLADSITMTTRSRVTGETYSVRGESGVGFRALSEPEDIDGFGTRVTLTVRDDIGILGLVRFAVESFWHSGIETCLHLPHPVADGDGPGSTVFRAGVIRVGPCEPAAYMSRSLCHEYGVAFPANLRLSRIDGDRLDMDRPLRPADCTHSLPLDCAAPGENRRLDAIEFHVCDDDIDVHCLLASKTDVRASQHLCAYDPADLHPGTCHVFLAGMPISVDLERLPVTCSSLTVNVKDERKYMPTPDRERFREEALGRLVDRIRTLLAWPRLAPRHGALHDWHRFGWATHLILDDYPPRYCDRSAYHRFLTRKVRYADSDGTGILKGRGFQIIPDAPDCARRMVYLNAMVRWKIAAIRSVMPDAVVFSTEGEALDDRDMVSDLGITMGTDFLAAHGLRMKDFVKDADPRPSVRNVFLYLHPKARNGKHLVRVKYKADSLPNGTILAVPPDRWDETSSIIRYVRPPVFITRKGRVPVDGVADLDDFVSRAGKASYVTNRGTVTGAGIVSSGKPVFMVEGTNEYTSRWPADVGIILIAGRPRDNLGLYMYLKQAGVSVSSDVPDPLLHILGIDCLTKDRHIYRRDIWKHPDCIAKLRDVSDSGVLEIAVMAVFTRSFSRKDVEKCVDWALRTDSALASRQAAAGTGP